MKTVEATPMDCIVCDCPYCGQEVIEVNADVRDLTAFDMDEEGELDCPHCHKTFQYSISN